MLQIYESHLSQDELAAIQQVKDWVKAAIEHRCRSEDSSSDAEPSQVWKFVTQIFEYLQKMPPEQFSNLRLHTYHIDGGTYWKVLFARSEDYERHDRYLCAGLPERYKLSAPKACGEYGRLLDGDRLVNDYVLRWQELMRALWLENKLQTLEEIDNPVILEIGGGYGSLAYHLKTLFPKFLYVIIDLPETLLFSAIYLTTIFGVESVLLVNEETTLSPEEMANYSFVLVPNHLLSTLSDLRIDLSINVQSFQEMTATQVDEYLAFLRTRTAVLLSWNYERSTFNDELESVTALVQKYFDIDDLPYQSPESGLSKFRRDTIGRSIVAVKVYNYIAGTVRRLRGGGPRAISWQPLKRYWAVPKV